MLRFWGRTEKDKFPKPSKLTFSTRPQPPERPSVQTATARPVSPPNIGRVAAATALCAHPGARQKRLMDCRQIHGYSTSELSAPTTYGTWKENSIFQPRRSGTSERHRRSASVGRHVAGSGAACCVMARPCAAFLHDFQFSSMVNDANQFVARDLFGSSRAAHATKRALTRCSQAFRSLWATQMGGRHLGPWCWSGVSRPRKTIVMMCGYLAKEDVCPTPLGAQGGAAKANDQSWPVRRLLGPP
jgi:hypothetical protein